MQDNHGNIVGLTDDMDDIKATRQLKQEQVRNRFMSKNDLKGYLRGEAKGRKERVVAQKFVNHEFAKLQDFVIKEFPDELSKTGDETAIDVAIKILKEYIELEKMGKI